MVNMPLFQSIEDAWFGSSGNMILVAFGIMFFFLIVMLIIGIDFRFALMLIAPLIIVFTEIGWFPDWVAGIFWVLVVGIAIFIFWNLLRER